MVSITTIFIFRLSYIQFEIFISPFNRQSISYVLLPHIDTFLFYYTSLRSLMELLNEEKKTIQNTYFVYLEKVLKLNIYILKTSALNLGLGRQMLTKKCRQIKCLDTLTLTLRSTFDFRHFIVDV
jgi:hypothetical protein